MRPLHVLHIIGGGDTGGAMSHLLPLLAALGRTGCDVHLLCLGAGGLAEEAERRGLPVTVLPMAGARDPRVLGPLRRLLRAGPAGLEALRRDTASDGAEERAPAVQAPLQRWDVVHTHGMRANLPVRLACRGFRDRPCLFTTVHSDLQLDYGSSGLAQLYQVADRATLGWVDGIVCVSDSLRALLVERGYPAERLITLRSGLETALKAASETPPGPAADAVGAAPAEEGAVRRPRVGTVARLVAVKDIDLIVEVAELLRRTHPEVEVVIAGDGPERDRLERLAAAAGRSGTVRFTGRLDDVGPLLRSLDVYMVTSLYEGGVSMSVLEAMENGIPVVTTAAGGVTEAVVDGETGYVVRRDQERGALAAALAERATTLLDDPALRARMGAAGALRVRAHFAVDETAARTVRAYERCLAARGVLL
jgi:glycosyltransferase involved in cell wall biosynthesis